VQALDRSEHRWQVDRLDGFTELPKHRTAPHRTAPHRTAARVGGPPVPNNHTGSHPKARPVRLRRLATTDGGKRTRIISLEVWAYSLPSILSHWIHVEGWPVANGGFSLETRSIMLRCAFVLCGGAARVSGGSRLVGPPPPDIFRSANSPPLLLPRRPRTAGAYV
jgi:hypothetical protein